MFNRAKKYTGVIKTLKNPKGGVKSSDIVKAQFGDYKTVIEGLKESEENYIFIFDPKGVFYESTSREKRDQGYQLIRYNLLDDCENLKFEDYKKAVVYINVETMFSTYEERGEALSKFLRHLIESQNISPIHLVFHQFDLYPIPHMEQFLQISAAYNIQNYIVVESQSSLQRIYGKETAYRILNNSKHVILLS
ncbi:TraM recognition domain-containing protein [Bacillus thuringiensis]|uniref:TraM recognition domain-containing protein n=1 Tax=Bacillus thuringiensis TaxID=1428 RepID=UPI001371C7D5|nr:TraM recognition domain-containing protein [Bacillus thuringiensis]MYW22844.1 TraM recognition domain-containing protein [Bacillus thuringiensis]